MIHVIDGQDYETAPFLVGLRVLSTSHGIEIRAVVSDSGAVEFDVVDECPTCHHFGIRDKVARSWHEAIEFGWLVPVIEEVA